MSFVLFLSYKLLVKMLKSWNYKLNYKINSFLRDLVDFLLYLVIFPTFWNNITLRIITKINNGLDAIFFSLWMWFCIFFSFFEMSQKKIIIVYHFLNFNWKYFGMVYQNWRSTWKWCFIYAFETKHTLFHVSLFLSHHFLNCNKNWKKLN